ncbi:jg3489, partial [Pararge aegeria aegeria]
GDTLKDLGSWPHRGGGEDLRLEVCPENIDQ